MGVDHTAKLAYGIRVKEDELRIMAEELFDQGLIEIQEDEPEMGDWDPDTLAEVVAEALGCVAEGIGNSYVSDGFVVVIGPQTTFNNEEATVTVDPDGLAQLKKFRPLAEVGWVLQTKVW